MNIFYFFRPKFNHEFQPNGNTKSNGNFKESMKSRTHLGFGGDGKYIFFIWNFIYYTLYLVIYVN